MPPFRIRRPALLHAGVAPKPPLRGALVVGADSTSALASRLEEIARDTATVAGDPQAPRAADLLAPVRVAIDHAGPLELADRLARARKALLNDNPAAWRLLRAHGIHRGCGPAPKVAFLYTGQGSQYVNMGRSLRAAEPIVRETFEEADRAMTPLLGRPLSDCVFVDPADEAAVAAAEESLTQTAITQPAVLALDGAITRLLAAYGVEPDIVIGHSLGEYAALVAAGALPFADALEAVSARGREMSRVSVGDHGRMAAVFAPLPEIERILATIDGYVVVANYNSRSQAVVGGASAAVEAAVQAFVAAGFTAVPLPVSHAFHTRIVAPASQPLRRVLERLLVRPPRLPVVSNVTGGFYPMEEDARPRILDLLERQIASPVRFVTGLRTLHAAGVRVFVEVGPKRALHGFVEDVFAGDPSVTALFANHPKLPDAVAFNQCLCGLYAAGLGAAVDAPRPEAASVQQPAAAASRPFVAVTA
ncbi:MAG TPA: acyltransferase domain-containing protein [Vicinamibacteria bacterium]|nr:acyltransferase domain-containing protein [Vicinamibacteria bacterium]